ncbi:hypothetical protein K438DRAFT_1779647 [Mycena galopus ATCC 62051]|nr:hypothetical protein K438DRAFT_1779647 [Mycena galopus ATCC 62051]
MLFRHSVCAFHNEFTQHRNATARAIVNYTSQTTRGVWPHIPSPIRNRDVVQGSDYALTDANNAKRNKAEINKNGRTPAPARSGNRRANLPLRDDIDCAGERRKKKTTTNLPRREQLLRYIEYKDKSIVEARNQD